MLGHLARCSIAPLTRRYAPTSPLRGEVKGAAARQQIPRKRYD